MVKRKRNSLPQLPSKTDLKQLIRNQTDVSLSFAKQVSQSASKDSNLVFSPPLIHVVLGLIAAGSKGPTQSQVLSLLNSKSTDDLNSLTSQLVSLVFADGGPTGGPTLSFANGVWVDQSLSLKPSFEKVVDTVYKAALNHVDFQTEADEVTNEVNQWAEKQTNGLIKEVLPSGSVDDSTRLIFANALYFKGAWTEKFNASKTKNQEFHLLNGSSVQVPFMTSFEKVVDTVYKAALNHVDFQTEADEVTNEVNQWAEKQTNGLIKEVLPSGSVNDSTRLIFANALYFKGAWTEKFNASKTKNQEFHLLNGSSVQVPFMTSEDKRRFSMYLYLPNAKDGLSALMRKMSSKSGFLDRHLPCKRVEVGEFLIPKFKFSFGFEASKVLKGLGLVLPFGGGEGLIEMVDSTSVGRKLYISSIFHKACIEVNEEGTKAAAASAGILTFECYEEPEEIDFVADHPFLFVIREDNTGAVLFIGQVLNPLCA
ncbi:hypothetical protein C3L33_09567, partial [Rhododendron williamsianum]